MKNLVIVLFGLALVAGLSLTGSEARATLPGTPHGTPAVDKPEMDQKTSVQELVSSLTDNLLELSSQMNGVSCSFEKQKFRYHCGALPATYQDYINLAAIYGSQCQERYRRVAYHCPEVPEI
eukprot:scpid86984/ scgid28757/ 